MFDQLQRYIQIPKPSPKTPSKIEPDTDSIYTYDSIYKAPSVKIPIQAIDVNQANSEGWESLPGIGPSYAGKILRFRESLGGFSSIEQIGNTWHFPDSVFRQIIQYLELSPVYRHLNINTLSAEELAKHPYLKSKQATVISRYRDNYGPFEKIEDLLQTKVLQEDDLKKLKPYIIF